MFFIHCLHIYVCFGVYFLFFEEEEDVDFSPFVSQFLLAKLIVKYSLFGILQRDYNIF